MQMSLNTKQNDVSIGWTYNSQLNALAIIDGLQPILRALDLNDKGLKAMLDDTNNVYVIQYGGDDVM